MATVFRLIHFLTQLRRYVLRFVKSFFPPALVRILRQVTLLFSKLLPKRRSLRESRGKVDKPPAPSSGSINMKESQYKFSEENFHSEPRQSTDNLINPNGETISLQDVAFSVYPDHGHGMRSASGSSQNLRETRSVCNSVTEFGLDSSGSESSHPPPDTQIIQPYSPTLPTTSRKYSASLPYLPRHGNESITPHVSSTDIELTELNSPVRIDVPSNNNPTPPVPRLGTAISRPGTSPVYLASPIDSASPPCLDNPRILPVMPEYTRRYYRRPRIQKKETKMIIQPLTTAFAKPIAPTGWIKHTHPEGGRYFFNKDKRVYTDADLYNADILEQATLDIDTLETFISTHRISLPQDTDLVVDLYYEDDVIQTFYYYVHHPSRTIFFLDKFVADSNNVGSWAEVPSVHTESHLRHEIEAQYWYFLLLYPHALEISHGLISELRDVALHVVGDSMTSTTLTGPFSPEQLDKILTLTENMEKNVGQQCVGAVSLLSRLMYIFVHTRFIDCHGEAHARLGRGVSVFDQAIFQRTPLIKIFSVLLFFAPDFHLRNIQGMYIDGIISGFVWKEWMKRVCDDWDGLVLLATVMLNANVAFLAIQSVDVGTLNRSPAQISSYVSVVASIGSILVGLLLTRQNRTKDQEAINQVIHHVRGHTHPEQLAILYSLPYAFLMWGMIWFLAAFLLMCFQDSSTLTRVSVGSLCCVVVILVMWCILMHWDEGFTDDAPIEPFPVPVGSDSLDVESSMAEAKEPKNTLFSSIASALPAFLLRRRTIDSQREVV